ncbi:MAG: hypothetical protein R3Y49_02650 [Rikenellaceae bacterium]
MRNLLLYFSSFIVLLLLQEFVLSGLNVFGFFYVWAYVMMIIMLPLEMKRVELLLYATLFGVVLDIFAGTSALITFSMASTVFLRPNIIKWTVPHDIIVVGGAPLSYRIGTGVFLRYACSVVLVYGIIHTTLEVMTLSNYLDTSLRLVVSVVLNTLLIYLIQLPLKPSR